MEVHPPAARARRIALVLSAIAVVFSLVFGFFLRRSYALKDVDQERALYWFLACLVALLVALLLRMGAAICELLWLERTWSNLPEVLRKVGPFDNVSGGMVIAVSFLPGIAWIWKLGLVRSVADGFEHVRKSLPFRAPVPRRLGMAAVIFGWVPGLNVYIAPFLWEMFATRIDVVVNELRDLSPATQT
jgi:hypothetical protein